MTVHEALYTKIRECFGLKSQMAQSAFKTVTARYKTVKEQLCSPPYKYKGGGRQVARYYPDPCVASEARAVFQTAGRSRAGAGLQLFHKPGYPVAEHTLPQGKGIIRAACMFSELL